MADLRDMAARYREAIVRRDQDQVRRLFMETAIDVALALERLADVDAIWRPKQLYIAELEAKLAEVERLEPERQANLHYEMRARAECLWRIAKLEAALRKWPCPRPSRQEYPHGTECDQCRGTGLHPIAAEALGMTLQCSTCGGATTVMATRGPTPAEATRVQCPDCRGTGMTLAKEET